MLVLNTGDWLSEYILRVDQGFLIFQGVLRAVYYKQIPLCNLSSIITYPFVLLLLELIAFRY